MKKLYIFLLTLVLFTTKVYAYGYDLSVTSNTVTAGNSISLNIRVSDAAGKFTISSSNPGVVSVSSSSAWIDNSSQSVTLRAIKEGSATISVTASDVTSYGGENIGGTKSVTITVRGAAQQKNNNTYTAPKSSNNFLSSLTIDNFKLNETFDKESLEYTLTVPSDTEKIKINAQLADSSATVTGTGEKTIETGLNTIELVVTAANGSKRTYKLNVTKEEEKPIIVKVDKQEYTLVRKRKDLPKISEYFEEKEVTINGETIEGYYNQKLGYTIVGLKDKKGITEFYIYKNNKYTLYKEYSFNGTILQVINKALKKGYKKTHFIYDSDKITSYQEVKLDIIKNTYALDNNDITGNQFYLFYAKNIETGKTSLYQYDALEKTVQRYNVEVLDMYKNNSSIYYKISIISSVLIVLLIATTITLIIVNKKKNKGIKRDKK